MKVNKDDTLRPRTHPGDLLSGGSQIREREQPFGNGGEFLVAYRYISIGVKKVLFLGAQLDPDGFKIQTQMISGPISEKGLRK